MIRPLGSIPYRYDPQCFGKHRKSSFDFLVQFHQHSSPKDVREVTCASLNLKYSTLNSPQSFPTQMNSTSWPNLSVDKVTVDASEPMEFDHGSLESSFHAMQARAEWPPVAPRFSGDSGRVCCHLHHRRAPTSRRIHRRGWPWLLRNSVPKGMTQMPLLLNASRKRKRLKQTADPQARMVSLEIADRHARFGVSRAA